MLSQKSKNAANNQHFVDCDQKYLTSNLRLCTSLTLRLGNLYGGYVAHFMRR
jgi:hypothetical protein